jgi:hypothetical protein
MTIVRHSTLREVLRQAAARSLEESWVHLRSESPSLESECVVISDSEETNSAAIAAGFHVSGLGTEELQDVADCAAHFEREPSDSLLLESFLYYWRFDAWLPNPGAPDPLPAAESKAIRDREFFDLLKPRVSFIRCRSHGCDRGAVEHSVLCSVHHYEMIRNEPCPFNSDA